MKNLFSNLVTLFLVLMSCLQITSCTDENNDGSSNVNTSVSKCDCESVIAQLTEKIEKLEAKLEEVENKTNDIENNLDYDIVFQKFNQYIGDKTTCDCGDKIEEIKKQLASLKENGGEVVNIPNLIESTINRSSGNGNSSYEYDNSGRICKISYKEKTKYSQYDYSANATVTYNGNVCTIECVSGDSVENGKTTYNFTFNAEDANDYNVINYFIITMMTYFHTANL